MRMYSEKAFQFDHPAGQEPAVIVQSKGFASVPDWVAESTMFKWASESGDITVIESKQDEKAAESGSKSKTKAEKDAEAKAAKAEAAAQAIADAEAAAAQAAADAEAANK